MRILRWFVWHLWQRVCLPPYLRGHAVYVRPFDSAAIARAFLEEIEPWDL